MTQFASIESCICIFGNKSVSDYCLLITHRATQSATQQLHCSTVQMLSSIVYQNIYSAIILNIQITTFKLYPRYGTHLITQQFFIICSLFIKKNCLMYVDFFSIPVIT